MSASWMTLLQANLRDVNDRIAAACARAGRSREEVRLIAVTKYVGVEVAKALLTLGATDLGESRPQELWRKAAAVPDATWHLVGHLQRNKVDRTLPCVRWIHSVDSRRLLDALETTAARQGRTVDALLEFNLSGEETKHGFAPSDVELIIARLEEVRSVHIGGLMTMAAFTEDAKVIRATFAALRQLRDQLARHVSPPHRMQHLSMGMTHDFEIAIEEGATMVRIGTALYRGMETLP